MGWDVFDGHCVWFLKNWKKKKSLSIFFLKFSFQLLKQNVRIFFYFKKTISPPYLNIKKLPSFLEQIFFIYSLSSLLKLNSKHS